MFFRVLENTLVRTPRERRNSDWEVSPRVFDVWEVPPRVFDVCTTKVMDPMNNLCEDIVFSYKTR